MLPKRNCLQRCNGHKPLLYPTCVLSSSTSPHLHHPNYVSLSSHPEVYREGIGFVANLERPANDSGIVPFPDIHDKKGRLLFASRINRHDSDASTVRFTGINRGDPEHISPLYNSTNKQACALSVTESGKGGRARPLLNPKHGTSARSHARRAVCESPLLKFSRMQRALREPDFGSTSTRAEGSSEQDGLRRSSSAS